MSNLKIQLITHTANEVFRDALSLVSEVVFGKPIMAQAACFIDLNQPCSVCGVCGTDKRRYRKYCWECTTCWSGCTWCPRGCACSGC